MMSSMRLLFVLALLLVVSCEDETLPDPFVPCPDQMPATGNECPRAGLVCHYFTGCSAYDEASCEASGRWTVTPGCTSSQGGAGSGGDGGASPASTAASTASSAATGGAGGTDSSGGSGGT